MCRNIKTLFNFDPPATDDEIQASALQFVRKLSGSTKPSAANQEVFDRAVVKVAESRRLSKKSPAPELSGSGPVKRFGDVLICGATGSPGVTHITTGESREIFSVGVSTLAT